jgi:hypothetical protein
MKIKREIKRQERGQIIVLLAVSLVVVMVVAALAVDGGMIYSERRFAQNAADASSLAGGGVVLYSDFDESDFTCPASSTYNGEKFSDNSNIIAKTYIAARNVAQINNVSDLPLLGYIRNGTTIQEFGDGLTSNHGVVIECNSNAKPKYIETRVKITSAVSTAFAHLIYPNDLVTTNEAVTKVQTGGNVGFGNAIISLSDTCKNTEDGGTYFAGSAIIKIQGAGTHSNSCLVGNGTASLEVVVDEDQNLNLVYEDANLNPAGAFDYNGSQEPLVIPYLDEPICGTGTPQSISVTNGETVTIDEGNYSGITITGGEVTFEPGGLFCMTGDLSITGGRSIGDGVTFFMQQDLSKPNNPKDTNVTITGNATALLAAPYDPADELFGILFFMDSENEGTIKLVGTNDSYFAGLVYAPTGFIDVGGTSSTTTYSDDICALIQYLDDTCQATTFSTQFIGWSVRIKGDGNMDILFDDSSLPNTGTNMNLVK